MRTRHLSSILVLASALYLLGGSGTRARGVPDLQADLALCPIAPQRDSVQIYCCGVWGYSRTSIAELMDAFPNTSGGRPLIGIGLGVRSPGLAFRYGHTVQGYLQWNSGDWYFFDPPFNGLTSLDSLLVTWKPLVPHESLGTTYFGQDGFQFELTDFAPVVITATVNLVATYATPGDTLLIWGTEIGMPDIELRREGIAGPTAVSSATWGQVKHEALRGSGMR